MIASGSASWIASGIASGIPSGSGIGIVSGILSGIAAQLYYAGVVAHADVFPSRGHVVPRYQVNNKEKDRFT